MSERWRGIESGDKRYLAAIGAVSLRFTDLEESLRRLVEVHLLALPEVLRFQILQPMSNGDRVGLLRTVATKVEAISQVQDLLSHFLTGFAVCSENRNIAVHAAAMTGETHVHLYKRASRSPYAENRYSLTIDAIHEAAVSMEAFSLFAWSLHRYQYVKTITQTRPEENWLIGPRPLPDRPALPAKLSPQLPGSIHPDDPIQF